jgi:tight adherence protein C
MGLLVLMFCILFLLFVCGGLLLFYRGSMLQRITDVINPRSKPKTLASTIQQTGVSLSSVMERVQQLLPKSQAEMSVIAQRLTRAGYREEDAAKIFYGCKVVAPLVLAGLAWISGAAAFNPMMVYVLSLVLGFMLPDFWLQRKIATRKKKIRRGLPDVLDLLIICIEAGLSMDQATSRSAEELEKAQPELCDELHMVVLEQRAGRPRADAWKHFADRTDEDSVRNLVSMLVQAEQFGTSVARTLRVQSDTLRAQRVQAVEEMAAKTSVKMVFPLVLCIFPSLFLVIVGPPIIAAIKSFKGF